MKARRGDNQADRCSTEGTSLALRALALLPAPLRRAPMAESVIAFRCGRLASDTCIGSLMSHTKQPKLLGRVVTDYTLVLLIGRLCFVLVPTVLATLAITWSNKSIQPIPEIEGVLTPLEEETDLVEVVRGKDRIIVTKSTLGTAEATLRCPLPVHARFSGLLQAWLLLPHH